MRVGHSDVSQKFCFSPSFFWATLGSVPGLLLPLHSGLTHGGLGGTIWGDQTQADHIQGKQAPYTNVLLLLPEEVSLMWFTVVFYCFC